MVMEITLQAYKGPVIYEVIALDQYMTHGNTTSFLLASTKHIEAHLVHY